MTMTPEGRFDSPLLVAIYVLLPLALLRGLTIWIRNNPTVVAARTIRGPSRTPPVAIPRERALSISSTERPAAGHVGSMFFKLPAELRNRVYEAYMSYEEICVYRDGGRLRAFGRRGQGYRAVGNWPVDMLPLLRTCRQIYTEAIPLLYSTRTFCFPWPTDFVAFAACVLPQRFALLSKIGMGMGVCFRCSWPPDGINWHQCHCSSFSDDVSGVLNFRLLSVDAGVRNQLTLSGSENPDSAWSLSCHLMSTLPRLEHLKLVIPDAPPLEQPPSNYDCFFEALSLLKREHLDVKIHLEGSRVGIKLEWRSKLQEIAWEWEEEHGKFDIQRKSDANQTWWEEWSKIQADIIKFQDWGIWREDPN